MKETNAADVEFDQLLKLIDTPENRNTYYHLRDRFSYNSGSSEYSPVRYEIRNCLIYGFNQAAITLTNHYLEKFLKVSIINTLANMRLGDLKKYDDTVSALVKEYGGATMGSNINKALELGIISMDESEMLKEFKNAFRNPFSHSDFRGIFGEETTNITKFNLYEPTTDAKPYKIDLAVLLPMHGIAQQNKANASAFAYFISVDNLVMAHEIKMHPKMLDLQLNKDVDFKKLFDNSLEASDQVD